jgi:hypothetical protein
MDVIPLDAGLVKGSHGRADLAEEHGPLFMSSVPDLLPQGKVQATKVKALLLAHVFDKTS